MDGSSINALIKIYHFPPVVHARHARALLMEHDESDLQQWVGGYAVTVASHRQLLEEILGSLAWKPNGLAMLVHGLYGAGKSHLLVLLNLLTALPLSWPTFIATHPIFQRYATAMQSHQRLVIHFSLDEYNHRAPLESAIHQEIARAFTSSGIPLPTCWGESISRMDEWGALFSAAHTAGYDGILLLIDELSLFLAAKTPTQREADAGYLQFLAEMSTRAPLWLIGALQRHLSDVGALRTHSWRQVEDRFRSHELPVQEIAAILRERLIERRDPAAIRALILTTLTPRAAAYDLELSNSALQLCWPFHPAALDLLAEVTMRYLSPHRSLVEVLLQVEESELLAKAVDSLITPLELFALVEDDLRRDERLDDLWKAVALLEHSAAHTKDPPLARNALRLLVLLHLAESPTTLTQLRLLLFDGQSVPTMGDLSHTLHDLRRRAAYLQVLRQTDPAEEIFSLAVDDNVGAQALARMEEQRQSFTSGDHRVIESALLACTEQSWPLTRFLNGATATIYWEGSEHTVYVTFTPTLPPELPARAMEGLLAAQTDGTVILHWPNQPDVETNWQQATVEMRGAYVGVLLLWEARQITESEVDIWREYAAWRRAAELTESGHVGQERSIQQRCRERADELAPVVSASLRAAYLEGLWYRADGQKGEIPAGSTLEETLGTLLADGLANLFPLFTKVTPAGVPSRTAVQQLMAHIFEPGEALFPPQSVFAEYLERYCLPLGCAEWLTEHRARITPPRKEILDALLGAAISEAPLRVADALLIWRRPPLGLTPTQAYLAMAAAIRTGVLQGLDAFLQPLDAESIRFSQHEEPAFLALPPQVNEGHRALINALAAQWKLPDTPWTLACSQVDQRLRACCQGISVTLPTIRAALGDWRDRLAVLPWCWQKTENALTTVERLIATSHETLETRLALFGDDGEQLFSYLDEIRESAMRWEEISPIISTLLHTALPTEIRLEVETIARELATGEACYSQLTHLQERITAVNASFQVVYRHWHDELFGNEAITALRAVFDSVEFRVVKWLARTPLPMPSAAQRCMESLAQARSAYCPGDFAQLSTQGHCTRCHLALGSPSPLPNAMSITADAINGLQEYAHLLISHPWATQQQNRLSRAPITIAAQATMLFRWRIEDGAPALLTVFNEPLLSWLCRGQKVSATRRVNHLSEQLCGHDMTRREAEDLMQRWLDPDENLGDDGVLAFE